MRSALKVEVLESAEAVAARAAAIIVEEARAAVDARHSFAMAVSGGHTPWVMLRVLATLDMPWQAVDIFQVDERIAPHDDPDRNLTHLQESLLRRVPLPPTQFHGMPVESSDLQVAAAAYAAGLRQLQGPSPVLDLVHLGLGPDGHTASLVPGDPVLKVEDTDVAITGPYQGRSRMTLTYPILNRARRVLWVVTGGDKAVPLRRLIDDDQTIPAGHVRRESAMVVADKSAAAMLAP